MKALSIRRRAWFQTHNTPHYDICQAKRAEAVRLGAVEIGRRQVAALIRHKRTLPIAGRCERSSKP